MKFSLEWLKQHLDTDASAEEIAEKLTAIGLEVEDLSNPAEALAPFRVAKVLTAEKHPQADKLQVLTVDAGTGEEIQIVCGAPNARAGMLGVFGPPGTYIPGSDITLKVAAIRGVESRGMMCSSRELELGEDHSGIIELPQDAPIGAAFTEYAGLDDPVFNVNVTPNRQDCMGVRGIARDLAAAGMGTLKPLAVPQIEGSFPCPVPIRIEDPDGCPAFFGRAVKGVTQRRLARLDAAAAQGGGPATDLGARRHHELCDARARPACACLRHRQAYRWPHRARSQAGRKGACAQRKGIFARTVHDRDRG